MNRREFITNTMLLALSSNGFSNIVRAKNIELNKELRPIKKLYMVLMILSPQLEWGPG